MTPLGWLVGVIGPSALYLILAFLPEERPARWGFWTAGLVLVTATLAVGVAAPKGFFVALAEALGWEGDSGASYAFTFVLLLWLMAVGVASVLQVFRARIRSIGAPFAYPVAVLGAAAMLLSRAFFD